MAGKGLASPDKMHTSQKGGLNKRKLDPPPLGPAAQPPKCPECQKTRVWKDGLRYLNDGRTIQRFLCRSCGYRFSEPKVKLNISGQPLKRSKPMNNLAHDVIPYFDPSLKEPVDDFPFLRREDVGSHKSTIIGQSLNNFRDYTSTRRVCVSEREMKNLAKEEPQAGIGLRGATKTVDDHTIETSHLLSSFSVVIRGKILEFAMKRIKQGCSEAGVKTYIYSLRNVVKNGANLYDPESVKEVIARMKVSNRTKGILVDSYNSFLSFLGGKWEKPKYIYAQRLPFIPLETDIDQLIAGCSKKVGVFLQLLKETGARKGEAARLKWTNIDFERTIVYVNELEKGSNPRQIKVSSKLLTIIDRLPRKSIRVFNTIKTIEREFFRQRKKIIYKLNNPRLLKISFHTLRHWKGTMEYHKTKDIMHVKYILGHKKIQNTLIYINLENAIFQVESDEFHVRVAETSDEIKALLEVGFEYVCQKGGLLFFRKRK